MGRFGLVSLGHGGFMGVGAYVTALLWNHLGVSPWLGIPVAMIAAAVLAVIVAYPCFRFRITGHYFVLVTLALSGIVLQVITATRDYTGGSLGYTPDRTRGSQLLALQFDDKTTWYLIALGVWACGLVVWRWVDRSMDRYALEAISEDEDAAAAAGVNVTREKLKITVISALMTALAGALYCQYQMFISPDTVSGISVSLQMVFAVIVGGLYVSLGPDGRRGHHHHAGGRPAHRFRHQGRRLGQSGLRRAAGGLHHLPAQGHFGQHRREGESATQAICGEAMTEYDSQNIFAKILRGEIPCYKVYENRHTLAFLDIMPRSPGHTLVIPKAPARGILDIAADDFAEVARTAKRIAIAAVKAFSAEGIIVQQFSEAASGQVVFHLHMHVMPMTTGVDLLPAQTRSEDKKVLEAHAAKMIAALSP